MKLKVWLDDQLPPLMDDMPGWHVWVRTGEALAEMVKAGIVGFVHFDHDLGGGRMSGYDVAKMIEAGAHEGTLEPIGWAVHSCNTVGAANIRAAMEAADRFWRQE